MIVEIPSEFGETVQAGKLSIQAFHQDRENPGAAYFRLYGLAMGRGAIVGLSARIRSRRTEAKSDHSHAVGFGGNAGSTAVDRIILAPNKVNTSRRETVKYQIHSRSAFNTIKVVFYRVEDIGNTSSEDAVYVADLGPITENGWLRPHACECQWDGKRGGRTSVGKHDLEVRAYVGLAAEWASAWSDPKTVRID